MVSISKGSFCVLQPIVLILTRAMLYVPLRSFETCDSYSLVEVLKRLVLKFCYPVRADQTIQRNVEFRT